MSSAQQLEALELKALDALYHHSEIVPRAPAENRAVQELYRVWVSGTPGSAQARALLHTSFRERKGLAGAGGAAGGGALANDW